MRRSERNAKLVTERTGLWRITSDYKERVEVRYAHDGCLRFYTHRKISRNEGNDVRFPASMSTKHRLMGLGGDDQTWEPVPGPVEDGFTILQKELQ